MNTFQLKNLLLLKTTDRTSHNVLEASLCEGNDCSGQAHVQYVKVNAGVTAGFNQLLLGLLTVLGISARQEFNKTNVCVNS